MDDLEQRSIMLPASVLQALKDISPGALKVLIYLSSRYQGQPLTANITTIADATGIQPRSAVSSLKSLVRQNLVTRTAGRGNQPNQYEVPLPERQELGIPPNSGSKPAGSPIATAPEPKTVEVSTAAAVIPATMMEWVATCYRQLNTQELAQLRQAIPDESILLNKLKRLNQDGGVAPDTHFGFFVRALTQ
jgi:DNA-binding MarR family transcriptional regulator